MEIKDIRAELGRINARGKYTMVMDVVLIGATIVCSIGLVYIIALIAPD